MELGSALVNGDYTSFHPKTVKMMIRMFDRNSSGTISFDEFVSLWRYLAAWRELFDRFDVDRSGRISLREFEDALVAFGYRLSQPFVSVLFTTFESKGRQMNGPGKGPGPAGMSFDLFVQACISLRRMTDVFKRYDDDRDGYITVSFEEFLTGEWTPPGYFQFKWHAGFRLTQRRNLTAARLEWSRGCRVIGDGAYFCFWVILLFDHTDYTRLLYRIIILDENSLSI